MSTDKHMYLYISKYLHIIEKLHANTEEVMVFITQRFVLGGDRTTISGITFRITNKPRQLKMII